MNEQARKVTKADLLPHEVYATQRKDRRAALMTEARAALAKDFAQAGPVCQPCAQTRGTQNPKPFVHSS